MRLLPITLATAALAAAMLFGPSAATAGNCSFENKCADTGLWGHAEPQPIHRREKTTFKVTVKNNGPGVAEESKVAVIVPDGLKVKRTTITGDGGDRGCPTDNGAGYVECFPGRLEPFEIAVVKVRVKAKRRGSYTAQADVFKNGGSWYDPKGDNNQVKMNVDVIPR